MKVSSVTYARRKPKKQDDVRHGEVSDQRVLYIIDRKSYFLTRNIADFSQTAVTKDEGKEKYDPFFSSTQTWR
jgi:hypothetical protein